MGLADLNLDKRLFHTDGHYDRLLPILARYGKRVRIETLTEEHLFTLESSDPELDVEAIIAEFGLTEFDTFIGRCTEAQQAARSCAYARGGAGRGSAPLPAN